jgi:hypothetical protein
MRTLQVRLPVMAKSKILHCVPSQRGQTLQSVYNIAMKYVDPHNFRIPASAPATVSHHALLFLILVLTLRTSAHLSQNLRMCSTKKIVFACGATHTRHLWCRAAVTTTKNGVMTKSPCTNGKLDASATELSMTFCGSEYCTKLPGTPANPSHV